MANEVEGVREEVAGGTARVPIDRREARKQGR